MNQLQYETSPYLRQHAHNPVNWYAWKAEALARAKQEDKLILISIGYSTCHWCHVMERESFEDEAIAAIMNENFICIKVDREERPDIDHIYMEAIQALSGHGGWPLNCFLTPDLKPFYGGTYFPPRPAHNRPSWQQVLLNIANAWVEKRDVVEEQAKRLIEIIEGSEKRLYQSNANFLSMENQNSVFNQATANDIFGAFQSRFDHENGGFGAAPKFPGSMSLEYLLAYHFYTKNEAALQHVTHSLQKMIAGGIYDHLSGGFARYTVDEAWLVPHFEKMLYDNALMVSLMSDAYKVTKSTIFQQAIQETLYFIANEMTHPEGGFYAAFDADSEGIEGKFYVWKKQEIDNILKEKAPVFNEYYSITDEGNWEHGNNILWKIDIPIDDFAKKNQLSSEKMIQLLSDSKSMLLAARNKRIRPGLDDKILLDWNVLMISAYVKAYQALKDENYKTTALKAMDFIFNNFKKDDISPGLYHTWKDGQAQYEAFLDDYAGLIAAMLDIYTITFDNQWIEKAKTYTEYVLTLFLDKEDSLFYFTNSNQNDLPLRTKDLYDSAQPSGNSTMMLNLQRLGVLLENEDYRNQAQQMLLKTAPMIKRYPTSFARWAQALLLEIYPPREIAIVGANAFEKAIKIQQSFMPDVILMASLEPNDAFPLLNQRDAATDAWIYICKNYACEMPIKDMV